MDQLRREHAEAEAAAAAQEAQHRARRHRPHLAVSSGIADAMLSLHALQRHMSELEEQLHVLQRAANTSEAHELAEDGAAAAERASADMRPLAHALDQVEAQARVNSGVRLPPLDSSPSHEGAAAGAGATAPSPGDRGRSSSALGRSASQAEGIAREDRPALDEEEDTDGESALRHLFRARCRDLYKQVDTDMSGTLEADELEPAVHAWLPAVDVKEMIRKADSDNSGTVGEDEFVEMMMSHDALDQLAEINKLHTGAETPDAVPDTETFAGNEFIKIGVKDRLLWSPTTEVMQYFEMTVTIVLIVTILTTPLSLAFQKIEKKLELFDLVVDCIFLADVVRNLNTGVVTDSDQIILDRRTITKRYITSWFVPDLVSSLPYKYMTNASKFINQGKKGLKMLRLLRLGKLARLMRMSQVVRTLREPVIAVADKLGITIDAGVAEVCKLLLFFFVCVHWISCVNFMISREYGFPEYSWTVSSGLVTLGEPDDDAAEADAEGEPALVVVAQASLALQYKWCLHKAMLQMIMVGHGENGEAAPTMATSCHEPVTEGYCATEYWFTLVCLYIGFGFQTYLTSQFLTILVEMSISGQRFREEVRTAGEYMRHKGLPADVRDRVREFYALKYRGKKVFDERAILSRFSTPIRQEILNFNSRELLIFVPLLRNCPSEIFKGFARAFENSVHSIGEDVFLENDDAADEGLLYFLRSGTADVLAQSRGLPGKYTPKPIASLGEGCYFGDVALLLDVRRTATVRCTTTCICYTIERESLLAALRDFPYVHKYMLTIARRRYQRIERLSIAAESAFRDPGESRSLEDVRADPSNVDEEDAQTDFYKGHLEQLRQEAARREGLRHKLLASTESVQSAIHLHRKTIAAHLHPKNSTPKHAGKAKVYAEQAQQGLGSS